MGITIDERFISIRLARLLGKDETSDQVLAELDEYSDIVTAFVHGYTRGRGFEGERPAKPLETVIVSAAARLVDNPSHAKRQSAGMFSVSMTTLDGFTLPELAVLHRYRKRTQ